MEEIISSKEEKILKKMKDFYSKGKTKDLSFRIAQLEKLKSAIEKNEREITNALELDLKRPKFESYVSEIGVVLNSISFTLKNLEKWAKLKKVKTPITQFKSKSFIKSEPYGVVLIIAPFNFPFNLCIEPLVGAIAAGNCAVIKPSEETPNVSKIIKKLIQEIFPKEYVKVVEGGKDTITNLIHLPFDYIFFTGSTYVGKIVMKAASENLVPVTLELGGKNPCIVDKDANLKIAAERIVWGKFFNAGQVCLSPNYLLVHSSIKKEFISEIIKTIKNFYGDDIFQSKDFSRIINKKHTERLISILKKEKEKIIFGGGHNLDNKYIEPTLIDDVTWDSPSMEEEIFGPILPIVYFKNIDKVISIINSSPKPLALYIFSENLENQNKIINNTSSGGLCINDTINHYANHYLPFGGVGNSGMGRYHGEESFKTFSHMKSVLNKSTSITMTLTFPPYTIKKLNAIKKFFK